MGTAVSKIRKRDGRIVKFKLEKISDAIHKAAVSVGIDDIKAAEKLAGRVEKELDRKYDGHAIPGVEEIQDVVERVLMEAGDASTAKAYILYRQRRKDVREAKSLLGVTDDIKLSYNSIKVLERRYLRKGEDGKINETPSQMFHRIAENISQADLIYKPKSLKEAKETEKEFYDMMTALEFMPNSPTLMNAGRELQQLSACFVLPVEDSIESIFEALKDTAIIHQSGGGTGFSFSRLRPKNDVVRSTGGVASGPISFMKVFDAATDVVKQGGRRRGANMGILRVDHPDILDFVTAKERTDVLTNFNISVGVTEKFMAAVESNGEFELVNPHSRKVVKRLNARSVFELMVMMAWKNGEPGIIFLDRINRDNPTPKLGEIESTNPCGEQPLLPYEACNLGSVNLSKMVKDGRIDYEKLGKTVRCAVHFLDNVIDMSKFPIEKIASMVHKNRKIGLGVMGFADMLIKLGIPYNSEEALRTAGEVMKFVLEEGRATSCGIAKERGTFPNYSKSIYPAMPLSLRNATITTIAPTGTISIIANCSSGIEPLFAISYIRNIMDNTELLEVNPLFEEVARARGFYSDDLMRKIAKRGSIQGIDEIPEDVRKIFVTSHDINPDWHLRMQAVFQKYTDNAVSKTVNFPSDATTKDIEQVFMLAYKLGCKGVTVYRDKSREQQVLNIESVNKVQVESQPIKEDKPQDVRHSKSEIKKSGKCPECGSKIEFVEGCATCKSCGYSVCSV
ncbi:MAG: vitamin B12-dependent ribonucleotide reductase [Candidatus Altiarchaeota archaeon]|nr:vitamin B12-dependent ribonucleotide reductase [Candidatus Altiarchaeota archaeon]